TLTLTASEGDGTRLRRVHRSLALEAHLISSRCQKARAQLGANVACGVRRYANDRRQSRFQKTEIFSDSALKFVATGRRSLSVPIHFAVRCAQMREDCSHRSAKR